MIKFTIQNEKVVLDPNIVLIEEFSNIVEYGKKKKDPDLGFRILLYVFYCCDLSPDNPMRNIDVREKPSQAMARALPGKSKFTKEELELVNIAIEAYNYFNETSAERSLTVLDQKIDELREKLANTEIEIIRNTTDAGIVTFASNEKIIENMAKQIDVIMTTKVKIKESAKKLENTGRVRGNKMSSILERGNIVRKKS